MDNIVLKASISDIQRLYNCDTIKGIKSFKAAKDFSTRNEFHFF